MRTLNLEDYLKFLLIEAITMMVDAERTGKFDKEQLEFWYRRTKETIGYDQEDRQLN